MSEKRRDMVLARAQETQGWVEISRGCAVQGESVEIGKGLIVP